MVLGVIVYVNIVTKNDARNAVVEKTVSSVTMTRRVYMSALGGREWWYEFLKGYEFWKDYKEVMVWD